MCLLVFRTHRFTYYYTVLCVSILTGVAVWFVFFRVPYASHVSYDPLQPLPALVRSEVNTFYQHHNATSLSAAPLSDEGAPSLRALLDFLVRFQHAGYFSTPMVEAYSDHYTESLTEGWIAGVLEGVQLDPRAMEEVEQERAGVGSIPGGSRKLNERVARLVSPIVKLMDGGDTAVASGTDAASSLWSQLEPDHRMWVYTGLAHCHSTPCRWAKMQLVSLWRDRLALFPQHENKEQWEMVTQLFHPDAHESKLTDASDTQRTHADLRTGLAAAPFPLVHHVLTFCVLCLAALSCVQSPKCNDFGQFMAPFLRQRRPAVPGSDRGANCADGCFCLPT